jgi:hypothetical protein
MKRFFFSFAILFFIPCFSPGDLIAQTAKGDQLFGAMATMGQPWSRVWALRSGRYDLYYQRFIAPRFSLGGNANFGYALSSSEFFGTPKRNLYSFGFGVESRYYVLKKSSSFQPYVFGGLETNWLQGFYTNATTPLIWGGLQANTGVGFDWYIRPNFALNARGGINFADIQTGHPAAAWNFKAGVTFLIPHKEKQKAVLH